MEVRRGARRSSYVASIAASSRIESDAAIIAVAANDRRARVRMAGALTARPDLDVRAAASARELMGRGMAVDVLVFHCDAVHSDELAVFSELKRESPELMIVVVCESANGRSVRRAVNAGVEGLVFAEQLEAALPPTVAAVLAGQTVVPRELRSSVLKPALSVREKQILGMVVMGFTNAQIGAQLFLAESTVKSHLSSAFSKLAVRSRNEAAALILDPRGSLGTGILAITPDGGSNAA